MTNSNKTSNIYSTYKDEYIQWRDYKNIQAAKRQEYLRRNPDAIKDYDLQRAKILLSSVDMMDKSIVQKSEENAKLVGEKILQDGEKTALVIQENTSKALENSRTILKNELLKRASLASIEVAKNHIINELSWNQGLHDKLIDESVDALEEINK